MTGTIQQQQQGGIAPGWKWAYLSENSRGWLAPPVINTLPSGIAIPFAYTRASFIGASSLTDACVFASLMVINDAASVAGYSSQAKLSLPPQFRILPVSYITEFPFAMLPPGRVPAVSAEPSPSVENQNIVSLGPSWSTA